MKIIVDAGHGPNTSGKRTIDGSLREYQFNKSVAEYVRNMLNDYGCDVLFTHSDQKDVSLKDRTDYANKLNAAVFVSIHANAYGNIWNDVSGIETYIYTTKPKQAFELATMVQNNLIRNTGRKNRGVKTADFFVLRETKMTAILVECGFMTNRDEAELLKKHDYREKCARSIVDAIVSCYKLERKPTTLYRVQVGAYSQLENAEQMQARLSDDGYKSIIVRNQV